MDLIGDNCAQSCGDCGCKDDEYFEFEIGNGDMKNCTWINEPGISTSQKDNRRKNWCNITTTNVSNYCPYSCGLCNTGDETSAPVGTSAPKTKKPTVSKAPKTKKPTVSKAPKTKKPTVSKAPKAKKCEKKPEGAMEATLYIIIDVEEVRTLEEVTEYIDLIFCDTTETSNRRLQQTNLTDFGIVGFEVLEFTLGSCKYRLPSFWNR